MFLSESKYLLFISAVFIINACSPEAGKKTLNFFFDGVPSEEMVEQIINNDSLNGIDSTRLNSVAPATLQITYHMPYLEKECASCHEQYSMGNYVLPQPKLCYQCHENFEDKYKILHGPVEAGYCTACHQPHYGNEKNLLKRIGQDLCKHCHAPGVGFNTKIHEGIEDTNCIECHNPHGGEDRLMFN